MADKDRDRRRDAAGVGPYARDAERLVRLNDMRGWDVAEGEPDIRAWEVRTIGGRQLGKVTELLIDPDAGEVVMLDVDLSGSNRHAFVPLRVVEIDRHARVVRMDSADLSPADEQTAGAVDEKEVTAKGQLTERDRAWAQSGQVRYASRDDERVVERRPIVEEVVVRRRVLEPGETSPEAESRAQPGEEDPTRVEPRE